MAASIRRGDNLGLLREIGSSSVDLVYADPPFDTGENRNAQLRTHESTSQDVEAFSDSFEWSEEDEPRLDAVGALRPELGDCVRALVDLVGRNGRSSYLLFMAERIEEIWRVLRPRGAFYLHCDPHASHHLRLLLDAAFGRERFRNEIIWRRSSGHGNAKTKFGSVHDTILAYGRGSGTVWNEQFQPLAQSYVDAFFRHVDEDTGRRFRLQNTVNPNRNRPNLTYDLNGHVRTWKWSKERMAELDRQGRLCYSSTGYPQLKQYLDESPGQRVPDVWDDLSSLQVRRAERLGFPTQKPVELVARIIAAHTDDGDTVLDPFGGSGTTAVASHRLGRNCISLDQSYLSTAVTVARLFREIGAPTIELEGTPTTYLQGLDLESRSPEDFRWWVLSLLRARPALAELQKGTAPGYHGFAGAPHQPEIPVEVIGSIGGSKTRGAKTTSIVVAPQRTQLPTVGSVISLTLRSVLSKGPDSVPPALAG